MCFFYNAADEGSIRREDWIRVSHARGVPCLNDAAADVPPVSNLWNYTQMGFDLVAFSGGKGMRGPQNAGLLLGKKDLIAAAVKNNSPNDDTVGRGMKVAKEQIRRDGRGSGLVPESESDAEMEAEYRKRIERILGLLKDVPTLRSEVLVPPVANHPSASPCFATTSSASRSRLVKLCTTIAQGNPEHRIEPGNRFVGSKRWHP